MKALVSYEIASSFELKTGIKAIPLRPYNRLDAPVSSHADMLFCVIDNTIFCYEDYVKDNNLYDAFKDAGYDVIYTSNTCEKAYPLDVSLNVLVMGKTIFCNKKYASKEVIEYAESNGFIIKNVNQGYSACSTLVLDENNAITSDPSIYSAMHEIGKNVLLIDNSNIELKGYNCGFIGGSACVYDNKIYIFGDYKKLPDREKIELFAKNLNYSINSILSGGVCDFGGIKLI